MSKKTIEEHEDINLHIRKSTAVMLSIWIIGFAFAIPLMMLSLKPEVVHLYPSLGCSTILISTALILMSMIGGWAYKTHKDNGCD